ncbi:MAG: hypothetical protein KBF08_05885, partial [Kiritimatiellae bacterium]|nr:hypothetical protein [Kiritimatiellia bacterium]
MILATGLMPRQTEAAYEGSGTFKLITNTNDITSGGYYVFVGAPSWASTAMGTGRMTAASTAALSTYAVSYASGNIVNPAAGIVWRIDATSSSWSIYSEAASFYVGQPNANGVRTSTSVAGDDYRWSFASTASSAFDIRNVATAARMLRYNSGSPRFACYSTGQNPIRLYKMQAATPSITLSGSTTAFSTPVGTPSAAQSLTVSGSDLSGDITVSAPTGFQVSKSESSGYADSITFTPSGGTVSSSTVYVRLTGTSAGSYSGNVTASSTGADNKTVAVSGTTASITLSGSPSAFSTTVGTPSAAQSLTVSGSGLTANLTVTAPSGFEVSKTSGSGYASSISFTPSGGSVASSTVYVRLTGASAGSFSGDVTASSSPAANKTVAVSGTTSAAGCGDYHHALYNRGTPVYTYYLGDKLQYQFEFALNQDTTGYTVEYGLGRNTTGTGWTWRDAVWSRLDGDGNVNRVWISKQNEQQFTDTGNWYYAGRFTSGGCTWYADGDWEQTTGGGFTASSYFTVNALNNPSGQSATRNSGSPTSQIDLSWSKNAQGHNVMV